MNLIRNIHNHLYCAFAVVLILRCNDVYTPKPKSYPRVDFPKKNYHTVEMPSNPVIFDISDYSKLEKEPTRYKNEENWYNIVMDNLGAKIYLTYKPVHNDLDILIKDSYKMTYKQQAKATIIIDSSFVTKNKYDAIWFYVGGDAATKYQFLVTDGEKHFLRGALYFNTLPNEDSLKIVQEFIKPDIDVLINSLTFTEYKGFK